MKTKAKIASRWLRFRALLIDIFLIYVPILYLFYFLLGSKEAFLNNSYITALCIFLFGFIQALFLASKAQSPGLKAYDLYLIDLKTGKKITFF
ncbi:TPA: RDD family protein, partial [Campylobacter coli]